MIITVDDFKTYAGIDTDDDDEAIELILPGVIAWSEAFCSNSIKAKEFVEIFDGNSDDLFLENTTNIKNIKVDQYRNGGWVELEEWEYVAFIEGGMVMLQARVDGYRNYRVTYTAGFEAENLPLDLKLAILKIMGKIWNKRKSDGIQNEKFADAQIIWEEDLSDPAFKVILKYRLYGI
ncbi:MAG: phage head-tail connector protein [bacterium]